MSCNMEGMEISTNPLAQACQNALGEYKLSFHPSDIKKIWQGGSIKGTKSYMECVLFVMCSLFQLNVI